MLDSTPRRPVEEVVSLAVAILHESTAALLALAMALIVGYLAITGADIPQAVAGLAYLLFGYFVGRETGKGRKDGPQS